MSHIPLLYIGPPASPWLARLRCIAAHSPCIDFQHAPDWADAAPLITKISAESLPLLAIDGNLSESFFNLPKLFYMRPPRVFLCGEGSQPVAGSNSEQAELTLSLMDEDERIRACLLERWVSGAQFSKPVLSGGRGPKVGIAEAKWLIASTVHDLRNPLAIISWYCNWATNPPSKKEIDAKDIFRKITRCADSMSELINRNLVSFQLDHGQVQVKKTALEVKSAFTRGVEHYERLARSKGLDFSCKFTDPIPDYLFLDQHLLLQSVGNLIDNAIKFTDVGFIKVTTSYDSHLETLIIEVQDTGRGITLSKQASIFDPFVQDEQPASEQGFAQGFGLGLDNAKRLARAMGGDVLLLKSAPCVGTTFLISVEAPAAITRSSASGRMSLTPPVDQMQKAGSPPPTASQTAQRSGLENLYGGKG